ncbi:MAG: sulfotransferase family protein [Bacteroidales bacterium]
MKTNLFIIGAAKSGTTSLYRYLDQHDEIYFSPVKETNFFSKEIDINKLSTHYKRSNFLDTDSYFAQDTLKELPLSIIQKQSQYKRLFKEAGDAKYHAEASVSYMYSPVAAKEIQKYNPNAKFIAILRNPAERAFSHYLMALRFGYTSLPFRQAFDKDMDAPRKGWGINELFYELGLYYSQLKKFHDLFPAENIRVYLFEDLQDNPQKVCHSIFDFLDTRHQHIDTEQTYNQGHLPKNPRLNKLLYRSGFRKVISTMLPDKLVSKVKAGMLKKHKPTLTSEDKKYLTGLYENEIKETAFLINRDLSQWIT